MADGDRQRPTSDWTPDPGAGNGGAEEHPEGDSRGFEDSELQNLPDELRERVDDLVKAAADKAAREAYDQGFSRMQSVKDLEIREREAANARRLQTIQELYSSRLEQLGASSEEVEAAERALRGRLSEMSREERLEAYDRYFAEQEAHRRTEEEISTMLELAGIPREHPDLDVSSRQAFYASVKAINARQKTAAEIAQQTTSTADEMSEPDEAAGDDSQPTRRSPIASGAADVLRGGGTPRGARNPIENIDDPDELLRMGLGVKRRR